MTEFASRKQIPGDHHLRRDIRLLGWQFRKLIQSNCEPGTWDELRQLRELAEQRQRGDTDAEGRIANLLKGLPVERLVTLTRAMSIYFDLANLAEDRHRVRVLRYRKDTGRGSETIAQGIAELRRGTDTAGFKSLLKRLNIEPVFTAHPTEAKRRTIRRTLRRLRRDLFLIDRPHLLSSERQRRLRRMNRDLLALWSTDTISPRRPTVMEELRRTVFAVRTLWRVGPRIMDQLRSTLQSDDEIRALDQPLGFGNWIGGDRDGNPFVTCDVTQQTLGYLRRTAVEMHRRACRAVRRRLTVSTSRCPLPESMKLAIDEAVEKWPSISAHLGTLHPQEWIVQWLTIIDHRLRASAQLFGGDPMAYDTSGSLARDVDRIAGTLREAGQDELATGALLRWQDRIRIFGLHLMRLDVRVNSTVIEMATHQLLAASGSHDSYSDLSDTDRAHAMADTDHRAVADVSPEGLDTDARDLVDVLTLTQRMAANGHTEIFGQFIVSMTHQPSDILALHWLMRVTAARVGADQPAALQVVPLFETIDDLAKSDRLVESLLSNDSYRAHVARNGDRIACMVGYSDSAKDGGYFASNWALYEAQKRLADCAKRNQIELVVFHGRGGAIGRGGGPAARAITSLPREAVDGRLRITEQGEVIAERYDDPGIAQRHLEQLFWATLWQSTPHDSAVPDDADDIARTLAATSMGAYRDLLNLPGFERYLQDCTALRLVEKLSIGSRPSRRTGGAKLEDLRAIPFTFAWNQVRMPINAFFGLGTAFESLSEQQRARAQELYQQWPWFRAVIDNAELALARCDSAIARRYSLRAPDHTQSLAIWQRLCDEYDASLRAVLSIKRESRIVEAVPWLRRTIEIRNPYLDMLNLTQLELMSRVDDDTPDEKRDRLDHAIRLTLQGIAAGLRNTG